MISICRLMPMAAALLIAITSWTTSVRAGKFFPHPEQLERLWNDGQFTEGVAVRGDGRVFFSDIARDVSTPGRIMQFDPTTRKTTVFCADSRKSNGLFFTQDGRLLACCGANGGARALCEVTREGRVVPLVTHYKGHKLNSPNDLVVCCENRVYFSDPRYTGPEPVELSHQSVYCYELKTARLQRVTTDVEKPNGVHVSPDQRTLYVAETNNGSTGQSQDVTPKPGRMTLNAFRIKRDGSLTDRRILVDFGDQTGIDGMAVDKDGHIFAAVRSAKRFGIAVYSPQGEELDYLRTPELPTNCCFGTAEQSHILYITAGTGLYRIATASGR